MRINLTINFTDDAYAVRVLESVSPDNVPLPPGLEIEMTRSGGTLSCVIKSTRGLDSLRATLEDLTSAIDLTLRTHEAID